MKLSVASLVAPLLIITAGAVCSAQTSLPPSAELRASYGKLPLSFEANEGQADPAIQFVSHGHGYTLLLRPSQALLVLNSPEPQKARTTGKARQDRPSLLEMQLHGANPRAKASAENPQITRTNYFLGNNPAHWHVNLPNYGSVRYAGVYPGIDLVYYGNQRRLEHDFVVAPGADPGQIRLAFAGASSLAVDHATGDLLLNTSSGQVRLLKPVSYQLSNGMRTTVPTAYKILAGRQAQFTLGKYNRALSLTIDPVLVYSTYLGGSGPDSGYSGMDQGLGIAVDASGDAYVVGASQSADFPVTSGAYQPTNRAIGTPPQRTAFISKLNSTGTKLLFSTYLGGTDDGPQNFSASGDYAVAVAFDSSQNVFVTGYTDTSDFPTTAGAFQSVNYNSLPGGPSGHSAFAAKLNSTGTKLVYSTLLGGHASDNRYWGDQAFAIAVDSSGNAFVSGTTSSPDFPSTPGAFQAPSLGTLNAFVTKVNPTGSGLLYSALLGPTTDNPEGGQVFPTALAIDSSGNAYITGSTGSLNFPVTQGAFQTTNHGSSATNAFVSKLNPSGSGLVYSTFFGGSGIFVYGDTPHGESAQAIAVDSTGSAYIAGSTYSRNLPIKGGLGQSWTLDNGYGFLAKFNPTGTALDYSTRLVGVSSFVSGLAVDSAGEAYVLGAGDPRYFEISPDGTFIQKASQYTTTAIFLTKVNAAGDAIKYATFFGGTGEDIPSAITVAPNGDAVFTGATYAPFGAAGDFPVTSGAIQTTNKGAASYSSVAFVSAFDLSGETQDHFLTNMSVGVSSASLNEGSPLSLTATVTGVAGQTPTGNVTFVATSSSAAPFPASSVALNANGVATFISSTLPAGNYQVYATYAGDGSHLSSNSLLQANGTVSFQVVGSPANIAWQYTSSGFTYGQFTAGTGGFEVGARVTDLVGSGVAGVPVTFSGAGFQFPQATVDTDANGYAQAAVINTKAGSLTLYASTPGVSKPAISVIPVAPAPLTITLLNDVRYYGAANPVFPYKIQGLVGSDTVTVAPQTTATLSSVPGTYPITATVSGPLASDYTATVKAGKLFVEKAALRIQAAAVSVTYGNPIPPITAFAAYPLVNGNTEAQAFSGTPTFTTTATATSPVGVYPIQAFPGTFSSANYSFYPLTGKLQIYKRLLTISPNSVTIHVGDPLPTFTYTLGGFVNGDTQASATTGAASLTTTAPSTAKAGRFEIVGSKGTLNAANYTFSEPSTATDGILTILP